jgi:hypothetical protein
VRAAPDTTLGQGGKPAFNLIEPGGRCWREVNMKARVSDQPVLDRRRLMCSVVVHHQVHIEHLRHAAFDRSQELEELAAAVAPMRFTDDLARGDIQRGE